MGKTPASRAGPVRPSRDDGRRGRLAGTDEPKWLRAAAGLAVRAAGSGVICASTIWTATWRRSIGRTMAIACSAADESRPTPALDLRCRRRCRPRAGSSAGRLRLGTYFGPEVEIFAAWEDAAHPTRVIALDSRDGRTPPHGAGCRGDGAGPSAARGDLCLDRRPGDPGVAWRAGGRGTIPDHPLHPWRSRERAD